MIISSDNLNDTIENLELLVTEHEKQYAEHPQIMGYTEEFFSHKDRADDYRRLLGYLKELQQLRETK